MEGAVELSLIRSCKLITSPASVDIGGIKLKGLKGWGLKHPVKSFAISWVARREEGLDALGRTSSRLKYLLETQPARTKLRFTKLHLGSV